MNRRLIFALASLLLSYDAIAETQHLGQVTVTGFRWYSSYFGGGGGTAFGAGGSKFYLDAVAPELDEPFALSMQIPARTRRSLHGFR